MESDIAQAANQREEGRHPVVSTRLVRYVDGVSRVSTDELAREEPLEIAVSRAGQIQTVSVTLRTPGEDERLALGFLFAEGIIRSARDVVSIRARVEEGTPVPGQRVVAALAAEARFDPDWQRRNFPISAACGACGKSALEALKVYRESPFGDSGGPVAALVIESLAAALEGSQPGFASTGGLHAAGRFDREGKLLSAAEDIGRHNALDKLVGRALQEEAMDWSGHMVLVSGRLGFDLMQKAIVAGCPFILSVGAPSSLAVELANLYRMTLVGFLRDGRFNVYSGADRIRF